jgi:hypothetical protein
MTKEEGKQRAKAIEEAQCDLYARVFGSEEGKQVLQDLIAKAPPAASRFVNNGAFSSDPTLAAWKDGRASIVAYINGRLHKAPYYTEPIN